LIDCTAAGSFEIVHSCPVFEAILLPYRLTSFRVSERLKRPLAIPMCTVPYQSHTNPHSNFLSGIAATNAKNHKRQRRKRQSVTAKRGKSQTPKVLTAILTLPNLTELNLTRRNQTYTNFGVCDFSRLAVTDLRLRRWRLWILALSNAHRQNFLNQVFRFDCSYN